MVELAPSSLTISQYHWCWYLFGFMVTPRLTLMIWLSLYFPHSLPLPLFIFGWVWAILPKITFNNSNIKINSNNKYGG